MNRVIAILVVALGFALNGNAQDTMMKKEAVKTIALEQTPGEFTQKGLTVSEGSYIFEISNNHSGTDVGFVLVPKGKDASNAENHIKTAYVTAVVKEGNVETSNATKLSKGEYVYFCPLNKTPQYTLTVE
ncbi:cupredoxin domain-containing protein [Seonamhaeicola sp. ML3]|uniref:cupredoxin domain-containing protein n=1 Tax=Seonamhaeicola sp. ML3 TaxID=2937786 RepID=UPI00200C9C35|nr:cupredoxin domain-containing protein [Seonamhaeicola sp. ML3]